MDFFIFLFLLIWFKAPFYELLSNIVFFYFKICVFWRFDVKWICILFLNIKKHKKIHQKMNQIGPSWHLRININLTPP